MGKTLVDRLQETNFAVLNSMDDWVRIVDPSGATIFINQSLAEAKNNSKDLEIYLNENLPLNLSSENEAIRDTTVVEEKLISNRYYSIKASPIFMNNTYTGIVEVFRDITRETMMKIELFDANRSMLDDVRFVRKVQTSILPKDKVYGNIDLSGIYTPSANVSGDLYDIVKIDDDKYAFYIADVMGHGVKASIMTMFIKVSVFSIFDKRPDFTPSEALLKLRERFYELEMDSSQYFTAWLGIFDFKENTLTYSNAGHNCPPMIYKNHSGECAYLHGNGRMISNIIEPDVYNEINIKLKSDDKILFFTDGAIEATNEDKREYGLARLEESFCKHKDLERVYKEINDYSWGEQQDDITLAMISYKEN
ncbi:SpoIIE family protein phosphatase [uncultured Anaerococcus sp.]|uniref:SpoIIE family protein phosphatase n=1 Tax=uncultured Anaerococcus sp. TaxID=293428 RepID=UPI0025F83B20|nr:SpoIIE family protein phosphatase [uncultured Anaerococcus sp.]